MTPEQIEICKSLGVVTSLPGTWDKRLIRSLECIAWMDKNVELTENQWDNPTHVGNGETLC